jgi:hypothetical protein
MAQTKKGQKFNRVASYTRIVNGKKQVVRAHDKSNPKTSKGKKK